MSQADNGKPSLDALRHSCAHLMAQAVQELFPGTLITIGPAIENGFYYDFDSPHRFTEEDLPKIENRMFEVAKGNHAFAGREVSYEESKVYWEGRKEKYKLELLESFKDQRLTHYTHDTFTDLCRGGHLENTRDIRFFKLLSVAGAYWRGDEKNPMLQRIYGTAWLSREDLAGHLKMLAEAKLRDHRKLGTELDLFSVHDEVGAGLIHWHPKGAKIRRLIEAYLGDLLESQGYQFVATPHISSEEIYKVSGHLENYKDLMYAPMEIEDRPFRAKPMNCPNHIMIFRSRLHSYRELPVRFAEFGTVYRFEKSGVLHGLLRVRGFTQDDAHIFCRPDQIQEELAALLALVRRIYGDFGFDKITGYLATRPESVIGEKELWDKAEDGCRTALASSGLPSEVDTGGGAFYGPKIDVKIKDAIGREWQLATIQLDFNLPRRFKATYRAAEGGTEHVVMIHRAILGSFERFFGILIEHYAGKFPLWLAPVQVKILTLTDAQDEPARALQGRLKSAGLRVALDLRPEKVGAKVRDAQIEKIPYMVVLGPRDVAAGTLAVRLRDGRQMNGIKEEVLLARLRGEIERRLLTPEA